jgi:hypothetical protein
MAETVAVMVFHPTEYRIVGKFEKNPHRPEREELCAMEFPVDDDDPKGTIVARLASLNIDIKDDDLLDLGSAWQGKCSDELVNMFALPWSKDVIDVHAKWVPSVECAMCFDPVLPMMMVRLHVINMISMTESVGSA